jgi:integrase
MWRTPQLAALTVEDVFDYGGIRSTFTVPMVHRSHPERQEKDMHPAAAEALKRWIQVLQKVYPRLPGDFPLFRSRRSRTNGRKSNLSRQQFWHVVRLACQEARIELVTDEGRLCTMSMYKTYLKWAHEANGYDILAIAKLAGHRNIESTAKALRLVVDTPDQRFHQAHHEPEKQTPTKVHPPKTPQASKKDRRVGAGASEPRQGVTQHLLDFCRR